MRSLRFFTSLLAFFASLIAYCTDCVHPAEPVTPQGFISDVQKIVSHSAPPSLQYISGTSQKVCQLIGETDTQTGAPTVNQTASRAGISGTDLGFSFQDNGKLVFLFGDTQTAPGVVRTTDEDAIATANIANSSDDCVHLDFLKDPKDGKFNPPMIPGVPNSTYDVPAGGVSADGKMYVYFTTDHTAKKLMGKSVLGVSTDGGMNFSKVYDFSSDKFINVDPVKMPANTLKGAPNADQNNILLFGSGNYRKSDPYLSITQDSSLGTKGAIKYFAGLDTKGEPQWSTSEKKAEPLFKQPCLGEFSTVKDPKSGEWIMLYNCGDQIDMRTAQQPWGPWTQPQVIMEPNRDHATGTYIKKDGGVYGPYMIPSKFEENGSTLTIYYTMSTWDPYSVVLMKSNLTLPGK